MIERIEDNGRLLCLLVKGSSTQDRTVFFTPPELNLQAGWIVYPAGGQVKRHVHKKLERRVVGTTEVLYVKKGRCKMDVYNENRQLVAVKELSEGDIVILVAGGHGFSMIEDTILLEVKQGPYTGEDEKERF